MPLTYYKMWIERQPWQYWNGVRAVQLGRSIIQYKIVDNTIRRFAIPYTHTARRTIAAVEADLRQWFWESVLSAPVAPIERNRIIKDMREALCIPRIELQILRVRPQRKGLKPGSSPADLADYLAALAGELRDIGEDSNADKALYASIQFNPSNPMIGDFLESARKAFKDIYDEIPGKISAEDALEIQAFTARADGNATAHDL